MYINMISTTLSDLRSDLKHYIDTVVDDYETIVINRGKNKGAVIISLERFNSMEETEYLISSKANKKALEDSIAQLNSNQIVSKKIEDLEIE